MGEIWAARSAEQARPRRERVARPRRERGGSYPLSLSLTPTTGPLTPRPCTPTLLLPLPRTRTRARTPTPEQVGQWRQRAHAWQKRAGQWRRRARGAGGEEAGQGQRAGSEAEAWCQSVALVALAERDLMAQAC